MRRWSGLMRIRRSDIAPRPEHHAAGDTHAEHVDPAFVKIEQM
jgi:hypothetical protein